MDTVKEYPIGIRGLPPVVGDGFESLETAPIFGTLPEAVHTGGLWFKDDEVWKPLDGRPYANAEGHIPTREAECLEVMAGQPGFPRNWRVETYPVEVEGVTYERRWLVRKKGFVFGAGDVPLEYVRREDVLQAEQGVRALNRAGWELHDSIVLGRDGETYEMFIVDLSNAAPLPTAWRHDDNESYIIRMFEEYGFESLAKLRKAGRHIMHEAIYDKDPRSEHVRKALCGDDPLDWRWWDWSVYASLYRPISSLWASIPNAEYVPGAWFPVELWDNRKCPTWVLTPEPLDDDTVRRYELTWAWSAIQPRNR